MDEVGSLQFNHNTRKTKTVLSVKKTKKKQAWLLPKISYNILIGKYNIIFPQTIVFRTDESKSSLSRRKPLDINNYNFENITRAEFHEFMLRNHEQ